MESNEFITPGQASAVGKLIADALITQCGKHDKYHIMGQLVQDDIIEDKQGSRLLVDGVLRMIYRMGIERYGLEYPDCQATSYCDDSNGLSNRVVHIVPVRSGGVHPSVAAAILYHLDHGANWVVDDIASLRRNRSPRECGCCHTVFAPKPFERTGDETCPHCQWRGPYPCR